MKNSIGTSEFILLILTIGVIVSNYYFDMGVPEKYIDILLGYSGGWTVIRQGMKATKKDNKSNSE